MLEYNIISKILIDFIALVYWHKLEYNIKATQVQFLGEAYLRSGYKKNMAAEKFRFWP